MLPDGNVEFAIAPSACFGESLNLNSSPRLETMTCQGSACPTSGKCPAVGKENSSAGRTAKFCGKCVVQWKHLNSFLCIANQLCFLLASHMAKFILFILHITAFEFKCRRGEHGQLSFVQRIL